MRSTLLLTILLLSSSFAHTEIYTWTNAEGKTVFSQTLPRDKSIEADKVEIKTPLFDTTTKSTAPDNNVKDSDVDEETDEPISEEDAERIAEGKKLIKEQCNNAKSDLSSLELGGNRLYKDSKGNYLRMTEEEKANRRKNMNAFISEHCQ
ncbi:MAG: hypothetical protein A6F71_08780 [Cycloclasticus sp. symbiont of Poecilosclerida sp. M]|nr:MAG: hypothetical protein A6F71_08780 [Cycloclasticus sp. symbiont of Poecilosclerida sp. M]